MADVQLKQVSKVYANETVAVKPLDLSIKDKEFLVFVGPSGCGKSTTLRMIAGLEAISDGGLYIGQELVNHLSPKDRDIAMVFQNYALYPHMSIYENIGFSLKMKKFSKSDRDRRIREAAGILGLTDFLERKPSSLSGGQRQRVALGRAMVRHPKVFLLDEPLSNLDAKLRVAMRAEIIKLHRKLKTTFVYVTHDQTEAMTMGDRIAVMNDGNLEQIDTPFNLYEYPLTRFVAEFIGSPKMSVFKTRIHRRSDWQIKINGQYINLGSGLTSRLITGQSDDQRVYAGIRPEDIQLSHIRDNQSFLAEVQTIEQMGSDMYIHVAIDECDALTVRASPDTKVSVGDSICLRVDSNKWHLFDHQKEKTLLRSPFRPAAKSREEHLVS